MKWIGQHIVDLIARFRSDVYMEDVSTGTIASGGNLGLDSNNKIVKAAVSDGDITGVTAGTGLSGGGTSGAVTLNVDAAQTQITSVGTIGTGVWQGTTIKTAYIGDNQITEDKLADTLLAEIDANTAKATNVTTNLTTATATDSLRINSSDGTDIIIAEASGSIAGVMTVAHHDKLDDIEEGATADQTRGDIEGLEITTVGTVSNGTWQGTAIASAYLDADTAHISATKEVTHHNYKADQGTTETYVGLADADSEGTSTTNIDMPLTALAAGKLLKVFLRSNKNINGHTLTFRLRTISSGATMTSTPAIIGAQSGAGCQNSTMTTYDFTTGLNSEGAETNAIAAGDAVYLTLESNTDFGNNVQYYITCMWEWNLS